MLLKKFLTVVLLMMMAQLTFAQVSNPFFEKIKTFKGAELDDISEARMELIRPSMSDNPASKALMDKTKSMKTLSIDPDNTPAARPTARAEAAKLEKAGMTKFMSEVKDAQEINIYILKKGSTIIEFFFWVYDHEEGFFAMQMIGTFTEDDLDKLAELGN